MHQQTTTILSYSKPCITLEVSNSLHSEEAAAVVVAALSPSRLPGDGELRTSASLTLETIENARRSNHYQLQEQAEGELF